MAFLVGELKARVDALEKTMATMKPPIHHDLPVPIPSRIADVIRGLSRGSAELMRHMDATARELLAKGVDENGVIDTLQRGSGG